jgi:hypothetical protein
MAKVEEQIRNIESMLQQILKNMGAEAPESESEDNGGCPYCGCNGGDHAGPMGPHGKTVVMIAKKKMGGPEPTDIIKNVLDAMMQKK